MASWLITNLWPRKWPNIFLPTFFLLFIFTVVVSTSMGIQLRMRMVGIEIEGLEVEGSVVGFSFQVYLMDNKQQQRFDERKKHKKNKIKYINEINKKGKSKIM